MAGKVFGGFLAEVALSLSEVVRMWGKYISICIYTYIALYGSGVFRFGVFCGGFFVLKQVWIPTVRYCIMFIVLLTNRKDYEHFICRMVFK